MQVQADEPEVSYLAMKLAAGALGRRFARGRLASLLSVPRLPPSEHS